MGKKHKGPAQKTTKGSVPELPDEPIGAIGWRVIATGALSVLIGFFVLSKADPMGRNLASTLSPFLILGGYAVVALGIFWPSSKGEGENPPAAPTPRP